MKFIGFNNLQAHSVYQLVIHQQGNRWIADIGHHGGSAFKDMTYSVESYGAIMDVTDPRRPRSHKHLPCG